MIILILTIASSFFYIGWWMAHLHYEDLGPEYDHILLPYFLELFIPIGFLTLTVIIHESTRYIEHKRNEFITNFYLLYLRTFCIPIIFATNMILFILVGIHMNNRVSIYLYIIPSLFLGFIPIITSRINKYYGPLIRSSSLKSSNIVINSYDDLKNICNPVVVGGGWSFWIRKTVPQGNIVFLNMVGEKKKNIWFAATKVKDVIQKLNKKGLTLSGIPSIDDMTLGGWVFSQSHGTGGSLWTPSILNVTVYDWKDGKMYSGPKKKFFHSSFTEEQQRRYIILEVEVNPVNNEDCETLVFDIQTEEDTERFFYEESYLRAIFVSSYVSTCILWVPKSNRETYFSIIPLWLWTSIPLLFNNAKCYLCYPRYLFSKKLKLSNAHMFISSGPIPLFTTIFSYLFTNFEIFVKTNTTPVELFRFCKRLELLFRTKIKGRCEIRGSTKKLFLDFAVKTSDMDSILELIYEMFGNDVTLHKGKVQVITL